MRRYRVIFALDDGARHCLTIDAPDALAAIGELLRLVPAARTAYVVG
jgi:hypothetical protein